MDKKISSHSAGLTAVWNSKRPRMMSRVAHAIENFFLISNCSLIKFRSKDLISAQNLLQWCALIRDSNFLQKIPIVPYKFRLVFFDKKCLSFALILNIPDKRKKFTNIHFFNFLV